jgi:hypothetical protein
VQPGEAENLTRFDGARPGFYEVYFVEVQDPALSTGLWVRYTLRSPLKSSGNGAGGPVAELWAMYFDRRDPTKSHALKRTVPFGEAEIGRDRFSFKIGAARLDQTGCKGEIEQGGRRIAWDLEWGEDKCLTHFPSSRMYSGAFPRTKVVSPHFDLRARGTYTGQPGEVFTLEDAPGQQSHLWGTAHALRWMWAHSNTFVEDKSAVFEALTAQVKVGPVAIPQLTMFALHYKGGEYLFNKPIELLRSNESRTDAEASSPRYFPVGKWIVGGGNKDLRFRGELWADTRSYLGVRYTDPDGSHLVCNHSKVANARLEIMLPDGSGGWRVADTLTSTGGTAIEFVGREPDPRIPVLV